MEVAGDLTYGQTVNESVLTGGSTDLGTFAWETPSVVPSAGTAQYAMTFTPSDATIQNYEEITDLRRDIKVTVHKAMPNVTLNSQVTNDGKKPTVTLSAVVNKVGGGVVPSDGTVSFMYENNGIYTAISGAEAVKVEKDGTAKFVWTGMKQGQYKIKAQFSGNSNYTNADSADAYVDASIYPQGTYPVIVASTGNGTVSADYAHAAKGTKVTLTAVPDEGFQFKEWKVISGNAAISNNSFTMPDSAVSIEAVFEKKSEPPIGGGGSIGGGGIGGGGQLPQGPDIVKNLDGSTTETIKQPDGTIVEITKHPDGTTIAVESRKDGTRVETKTDNNGNTTAEVKPGKPGTDTTVMVPTPNKPAPGEVLVIVNADRTEKVVPKSIPGEKGLTFTTDKNVTVKVENRGKTFTDVPHGYWAEEAITFVTARGLFNGVSETRFAPNQGMTRGMLAVVLYNLESNPQYTANGSFTDVADDTWYKDAALWAAQQGIVNGYSNGNFGANDQITREQLAVMLYRYAGSPAVPNLLLDFTDADQVDSYADSAMRWAVEKGIIGGKGNGILDPKGTATRTQVAAILMRFMVSAE